MGTCKGCKKVFNHTELKDGYCESCRIEKGIEEPKIQEEIKVDLQEQTVAEQKEQISNDTKLLESISENIVGLKRSMIFLTLVMIAGMVFYAYTTLKGSAAPVLDTPNLATVQGLVAQYDYMDNSSDASVLASYKKDGEIVELVKVGNRVCRMPMIRDNDGSWLATGFKCGN